MLNMARHSRRSLWTAKVHGTLSPRNNPEVLLPKKPYIGRVLGIDPSLRGTGLALLNFNANSVVTLEKNFTVRVSPKYTLPDCLKTIWQAIYDIVSKTPIRHVAIEQTIYVQNFQTAQILGAARGAVIAAVAIQNIPIFEYAPLRIKQAIVGYGRASKEQLAKTVRQHLGDHQILPSDEADAVGTALCHAFTWREN